ncbi:LysR family transcriptional regulator [Gluconacetobacter azotocaptans]|uniref:LysR family transcriptional regulator n=1 Tax=Gluconacetobacter azotocaptans TaxID=142834 RepID=A0A7W4PD40_9PROT|nr:LysR family transcriptional regulator [Gluconacetobacter azotocaptans]MBB2189343.1 LysR family transcriptional regulator [Gluconacetobacter azotocaptans]MBM9401262.1 LysR family transcriptional regulator [Gluconacetobacter azotocaptans]GBQ28619.1 LysR family transcriptional regulator [Gluconacetobacter azotocaptans DSM 13594]
MDRLQAMTYLVRVVETGSFSAAARQLNVGQPAVSKAVALLEQHLGVRLLLRSTHGLTPTEAGLRYVEAATRALEEADAAERAARGSGAGLGGRLRISAPTTFARQNIIPHLGGFLSAHPDLDLEIVLDDRRVDLVAEGIDMCLRVGPMEDTSLVARQIARGRRSVIATPAYFDRAGRPRTPGDLERHDALIYTQGRGTAWTFRQGTRDCPVTLRGRLRLSAAEGIRAATLADLGLTIASDWMFAPELEHGRVARVLEEWTLPPIDLWAVFPAARLTSAKARAFTDFVSTLLAPS